MDQTIRDCDQCNGTTKVGNRCSRRTCKIGTYCFQHLKSVRGLAVKKSSILNSGNGLFATRDIIVRRGSTKVIIPYTGEVMTRQQVTNRYGMGLGQYVFCRSKTSCVDGRSSQASVGRYANACDCPGQGLSNKCNSKFSKAGNLVATKTIRTGTEILVKYGQEYWA